MCVCEGNVSALSCSAENFIAVNSALYGRRVHGSLLCPYPGHSVHHNANVKTNCDTTVAADTAKVKSLCDGKSSCSVRASTTVFKDDPCQGTYKYLRVTYTCSVNNVMSYSAGTYNYQGYVSNVESHW